jgi:hypothetical protein
VVSIGISALTALNTVLSPMFLSSSETSFRKSVSVIVLGLGLAICAESAVGIAFAKTTSTTGMVALNTPAIYTITFLFCVFQIVLLKAYSVDRLWIAPVSAFIGCGTYLANALIGSNVENSLVFGYSALCGSAFALAIVGKLLSMRIGKRI